MFRVVPILVIAVACAIGADAARAQMSPTDLLTRIERLEATIRELTGTVEQLQYRNQQLEQQLAHLQEDLQNGGRVGASSTPPQRPTAQYSPPTGPYSPPPPAPYSPPTYSPQPNYSSQPTYSSQPSVPSTSVAAAAPLSPSLESAPTPSSRRGDAFDPSLNPNAPGVPRQLGAPGAAAAEPPPIVSDVPRGSPPRQPGAPLDLSNLQNGAGPGGELPGPPPANPSATGMQAALPPTLPPGNTPKDEYDLGYGYFQHKDYDMAATTFRGFLKKYPSDRLTPEAQYWLGESLFQGQKYRDAAEAFLTVSTKYDTTARAPDALLRLGQSLSQLGEKEAACASLGEVLRKYPRASLSVKQGVDREQKRAHC